LQVGSQQHVAVSEYIKVNYRRRIQGLDKPIQTHHMSDEIAEFIVICFRNDTATDACLGMFKLGMFNSNELQPTASFNLTMHSNTSTNKMQQFHKFIT
jgi:O-succinylbenzoate synthase